MKASEKDILTAFLGKTLNMPTEKVAQLFEKNGEEDELKSDSLKVLTDLDGERVKKFKEEGEEKFLNGQKKATKELGTSRDKEIKEKYGIDSDKIGIELIEDIIQSKLKAETLDEEKVKVHPAFLKKEKELLKLADDKEKAAKKELEDFKLELAEKEQFSTVVSETEKLVKDLNFVLPEDEKLAKNQLVLLHNDLKGLKFQKEGDETILLKDGKRVEDIHGKPITLKTFVEEKGKNYWPVGTGENREGAGGGQETATQKAERLRAEAAANGGKKKWAKEVPKTEAEFSNVFATLTEPTDRVALMEAYEAGKATKV